MKAVAKARDADKSREMILRAAAREFADEGLAGARTERIAKAARVNKALIHYYFKDKETLYGAVLDSVFAGMSGRVHAAIEQADSPREKILAWAGAHFDYIAASPVYPRVVQREMMRGKSSPHVRRIVRLYLRPVMQQVVSVLKQGIASGEFRRVNPQHFLLSVVSMNVFYFSSAQVIGMLSGRDPLARERIAERREAVLDQIAAALLAPQKERQ